MEEWEQMFADPAQLVPIQRYIITRLRNQSNNWLTGSDTVTTFENTE